MTSFTRFLALLLCMCGILALSFGCTSSRPTALSPVPQAVPANAEEYPLDASFVAKNIFRKLQEKRTPGADFSQQACDCVKSDFTYPGFELSSHRLLEYRDREDGREGRSTSGILRVEDSFGRSARILYSSSYTLGENSVDIDSAQVAAIYPQSPSIRMMLIPKVKMPESSELPKDWAGIYTSLAKLDNMPAGGLTESKWLDTHTLVLFLMDQTPPEATIDLELDLPDRIDLNNRLHIPYEEAFDFDGWRVAIISLMPQHLAHSK
ncbi:hypothetical protein [Desulfobaculum bizertense]|uniref:Outer membrane lipoprotein-sorting protein n=1 Tax=Desulfobaculum bizertense DSM 18034 TaxID=1121442 RepID=A0A1T4VHY0_9BACT|nr:hypothetical protein [Desulfobaculum bizertense]UIJ37866.1 hypothetical protein LWC08_14400 [Desulfobaculum bizertense]SKA64523.1 hypothetical protein SAMN02745702_00340 [Desulfobaculum bizertense DSM 18034]